MPHFHEAWHDGKGRAFLRHGAKPKKAAGIVAALETIGWVEVPGTDVDYPIVYRDAAFFEENRHVYSYTPDGGETE